MPKSKRGGGGGRDSPSDSEGSEVSEGAGSKIARSASGGFRKPTGARAPSARKRALDALSRAEEAHRKAVLTSNDAIKARDLAFGELNSALGSDVVSKTIATAFTGATIGVAYDRALLLGTAVRQLAEQIKAKRTMLEAKDTVTGAQVSARGAPRPSSPLPPSRSPTSARNQTALNALKSHEPDMPVEVADGLGLTRDATQDQGEGEEY
jgi:hypothetical protein